MDGDLLDDSTTRRHQPLIIYLRCGRRGKQDLGRQIERVPNNEANLIAAPGELKHAIVGQLDLVALVKEHVGDVEVAVHDAVAVQKRERLQQLEEKRPQQVVGLDAECALWWLR